MIFPAAIILANIRENIFKTLTTGCRCNGAPVYMHVTTDADKYFLYREAGFPHKTWVIGTTTSASPDEVCDPKTSSSDSHAYAVFNDDGSHCEDDPAAATCSWRECTGIACYLYPTEKIRWSKPSTTVKLQATGGH